VYTIQAYASSYADGGTLSIYAATSEDKGPEMLPVICDEVKKLAEGVEDQELVRAKNQIKAGMLMARESSAGSAEWIGRHLMCYGRYKPASELVAQVEAVMREDLARVVETLLSGKNRPTLAALGPQKGLPDYALVEKRLKTCS